MTATATVNQTQPQTETRKINDIIDEMARIRQERKTLAAADKLLKEAWATHEQELIETLDAAGTMQGKGPGGTASITEDTVAQFDDFDAFWTWVRDNDAGFLFQRRLNNAAWRELREANGEEIPGLVPFKKRSISLKSA